MKIGLLTTSFPRSEHDVAGAFVLGFARSLAARGHSIEVLAPEPAEGLAPPAWPSVQVRWIPYLRPRALERTFYGAGVPDNLRIDPRAWLGLAPFSLQLARTVRAAAERWDAIVSHWALPSGLAATLVSGRRPHLCVVHSADLSALERLPGGRRLARRVARGASAMLFVSLGHRDRFLSLLPAMDRSRVAGSCHVSPMGIDGFVDPEESRRALRARLELRGFVALSLGRLIRIKGVDDAIRAVAETDASLVVAGDGPERRSLERLGASLDAPVRFVGEVHGEAKRDWLAAADAFVCPSRDLPSGRTEGVPTTVLEAMSAGLPVIASDVGGLGALLEDGKHGVLVPPGRPGLLARAIGQVGSDRNLRRRMSRSARTRSKDYRWSAIAPHVEALLSSPA